jgi:large subunit ribosomal protein L22
LVAGFFRGMNVGAALTQLSFSHKRIAVEVKKGLQSAIANAENNHGLKRENLVVHRAYAQTAGSIKRFIPKARGSAGPILKRSSHIKIILTEL